MLTCNKCNETKDESLFNWTYRKGKPTRRRSTCTPCVVILNKAYRNNNQKEYNKKAQLARHEKKQRAVTYKGGICEDCSQTFHWAAFDFHHVDPQTKHKDPGLMMSSSDETLFRELDKCVLLCANCHRIRHFNETV